MYRIRVYDSSGYLIQQYVSDHNPTLPEEKGLIPIMGGWLDVERIPNDLREYEFDRKEDYEFSE